MSTAPIQSNPVKVPFSHRWQVFRRKWLQLAVWVIAIVFVSQLVALRMQPVDAIGVAEEEVAIVRPLADGIVRAVKCEPFGRVEKGDVVAVLQNEVLNAQLETARQELARLNAQYETEETALTAETLTVQLKQEAQLSKQAMDKISTVRRLELDRDKAELDYQDRCTEREADLATLQYLEALVASYEQAGKAIPELTVTQARAKRESLRVKTRDSVQSIETARRTLEDTKKRLEEAQGELPDIARDGDLYAQLLQSLRPAVRLAPLRSAISAQQARVSELSAQIEWLILRSPITGDVTSVACVEGQACMRGTELVKICSASTPYVTGWIEQTIGIEPQVGDPVQVVTRSRPRRAFMAKVIEVGRRVQRFPLRLRPDLRLPLYGRSVMIGGIEEGILTPGEVLDLQFNPKSSFWTRLTGV